MLLMQKDIDFFQSIWYIKIMKICSICKLEYNFDSFLTDKTQKDGHRSACKPCYYKQRNERVKSYNRPISVDNKICHYCKLNKLAKDFHRNKAHPDGLENKCKECRKNDTKNYYQRNKEKIKDRVTIYNKNNKQKMTLARRKYQKHKSDTDVLYKLARRLRNRLYYALKRTTWKKGVKFNEYIGCSLEELRNHIEKQFTEGMTWEAVLCGKIHIDHIYPLSKAFTEEEMYKLCHYTNLQPMWAKENIKKSNKLSS